jgi:hypothetical protein
MNDQLINVYEQMQDLWGEFQLNHNKFVNKGNKSAAQRARVSIQALKNLISEYRKTSVTSAKVIEK